MLINALLSSRVTDTKRVWLATLTLLATNTIRWLQDPSSYSMQWAGSGGFIATHEPGRFWKSRKVKRTEGVAKRSGGDNVHVEGVAGS